MHVPPCGIVLADSVTRLDLRHCGGVLVTGSHGGLIAARYAAAAHVRAAIFNDAGRGLDDAGVAGMRALADIGMAAAVLSHRSARIADAQDAWDCGVVSDANRLAQAIGVIRGVACRDAAVRLLDAPNPNGTLAEVGEARTTLHPADRGLPAVVGVDSIGQVGVGDESAILVVGSHGALHGGDPQSALPIRAVAAFFHDAGRGKDDVGTSRLPVLDRWGIPAGTVDGATARIGDARSMWETGRLSCVGRALWSLGVTAGMPLAEAVERLRRRRPE